MQRVVDFVPDYTGAGIVSSPDSPVPVPLVPGFRPDSFLQVLFPAVGTGAGVWREQAFSGGRGILYCRFIKPAVQDNIPLNADGCCPGIRLETAYAPVGHQCSWSRTASAATRGSGIFTANSHFSRGQFLGNVQEVGEGVDGDPFFKGLDFPDLLFFPWAGVIYYYCIGTGNQERNHRPGVWGELAAFTWPVISCGYGSVGRCKEWVKGREAWRRWIWSRSIASFSVVFSYLCKAHAGCRHKQED